METNDEFDFDLDSPLDGDLPKTGTGKEKPKVVKSKVAAANIDPEDDRDNWPVIRIESEDGKPNYEFMSVQGTKKDGSSFTHDLQIMREVDVAVPPSVVYALKDAISAHYVPYFNAQTGKNDLRRQNRSSVPWRMVKSGKYC